MNIVIIFYILAKNKTAIQNAGAIPLLANLLESKNEQLLIPVVEILKECASSGKILIKKLLSYINLLIIIIKN